MSLESRAERRQREREMAKNGGKRLDKTGGAKVPKTKYLHEAEWFMKMQARLLLHVSFSRFALTFRSRFRSPFAQEVNNCIKERDAQPTGPWIAEAERLLREAESMPHDREREGFRLTSLGTVHTQKKEVEKAVKCFTGDCYLSCFSHSSHFSHFSHFSLVFSHISLMLRRGDEDCEGDGEDLSSCCSVFVVFLY